MSWLERLRGARERSRTLLGINRRNLQLVRRLNDRTDFPIADDKILAKEFLAEHDLPTAPTLATYTAVVELGRFPESLHVDSLVLKPSRGRGGSGILIAGRDKDGWRSGGDRIDAEDLRTHAAQIIFGAFSLGAEDRVLVEQRLFGHAVLQKLSPRGLADLRVLLVEGEPRLAMLRLATADSHGKANLHQGGIGVGVDLETGRTHHATRGGQPVTHHPDTGLSVIGVDIPVFDRILEISHQVGEVCPLEFVGIDITIDQHLGPLILELNARPGLEIQAANLSGLRALLELDP